MSHIDQLIKVNKEITDVYLKVKAYKEMAKDQTIDKVLDHLEDSLDVYDGIRADLIENIKRENPIEIR